jgi:hypothetical protein
MKSFAPILAFPLRGKGLFLSLEEGDVRRTEGAVFRVKLYRKAKTPFIIERGF